ncbi:hypothetical protein [Pseudomonas oryzihabitans]|uniref:hypothetical protein n=1 Tax=Pseudomonas oryzihabitans TaxID=47885 RepID=UPI00119D2FE4|nr:hypothetical protein [Pseudomonas oryzihabitans]
MRWILMGLGGIVLAGCASSAIPLEKATSAPPTELFAFQEKTENNRAQLTVMRDGGAIGSACDIAVFVDGIKAANLGSGEKASFWVEQGVRNVSIGWSNVGICTSALNSLKTLSAETHEGKPVILRASVDMQGIYLNPYVQY